MLEFRPLTINDIEWVRKYLTHNSWRTCDMTVGGIFLWADYFNYSAAEEDGTLFILGVEEDRMDEPAFSVPVGDLPLDKAVDKLKEYCRAHCLPLVFSAVPEPMVEPLKVLGAKKVTELDGWGDYLYDAESLATFAGKKLMKKRNHVNRFKADHPDAVFEPLTKASIPGILRFYEQQPIAEGKSQSAWFDRQETIDMLHHVDEFGFTGAVLSVPERGVVAFTLGEVVDDTLYVHIEKMDHTVTGSGETICREFSAMMLEKYPQIKYLNREDSSGDEGLKQAKLAYHPIEVLKKFNVEF